MALTYYDLGVIVDAALATGHTLRVEFDAGTFDLAGDDLRSEWDDLAPGEAFDIHGWIARDGELRPVGEPTATAMRITADMLRNARGDADRLASAAESLEARAALRD